MTEKRPSLTSLQQGDEIVLTIRGTVEVFDNALQITSPGVNEWTEGVVFAEVDDDGALYLLDGMTVEKGSS